MRVKFQKGKQREFINLVLEKTSSPSLSELISRGIDVKYSSLKNYYSERRLLPEDFFILLCKFAGLNKDNFNFKLMNNSWGQVIGGKIGRK